MSFTMQAADECGVEPRAALDEFPVRRSACRVDFYLVYVAIGVAGFKMSWTARSRARADGDGRCDSDICLVPEFSPAVTSSTATQMIQWGY